MNRPLEELRGIELSPISFAQRNDHIRKLGPARLPRLGQLPSASAKVEATRRSGFKLWRTIVLGAVHLRHVVCGTHHTTPKASTKRY